MTNHASPRFATMALAAVSLLLSGCLQERHLIGETPVADAGTGRSSSAGAGGHSTGLMEGSTGGQPGGMGAFGGTPMAGTGGAPASLGDEVSRGWPLQISAAEVARRLSQFVLRQPPSDALVAAIVATAPATNQDVGQLTEGLLLRDDSLAGRQAFYRWWLQLHNPFDGSDARYTALTGEALIDQTLEFVEDVTWRPDGDLATLLMEPTAFVTAETAGWFPGVVAPPSGAPAMRTALDGARYAGVLTQPATLLTTDFSGHPAPSERGRGVSTRYLCQPVPHPPANLIPQLVIEPGQSIRQALQAAETSFSNPALCQACHSFIDGPGFSFGHFDAVGAYQDSEAGVAVDTSGSLIVNDGQGNESSMAFDTPVDLARILAALPTTSTCFATKWLAFSTGAYPDQADVVDLAGGALPLSLTEDAAYVVARATIQSGLNLRAVIRAVTETHTFLDP